MAQSSAIFLFLRYCLGDKVDMSIIVANIDWQQLYSFATKQTIIGLCFNGIERLGKEFPEKLKRNSIGRELLMTWMAKSQQIRRQNNKVNEVAAKLYSKLTEDGLRCCILKGQGNALMYQNPYSRTPGDVDVWVNANRKIIMEYASKKFELEDDIRLQHLETSLDGVPVELHFFPCSMNNPIYNARLRKWCKRNADLQCSNVISLPDGYGEITVPTTSFNVIHSHLYRHVFTEGIGLRQLIGYYFVLVKSEERRVKNLTALQRELKYLGLWKFAGAVMYVLHETLGLPEEKMIAPIDVYEGRFLLTEIMQGGNFGQYDTRLGSKENEGKLHRYLRMSLRNLRFVKHYPTEALSEPLFRTWFALWKKIHGIK